MQFTVMEVFVNVILLYLQFSKLIKILVIGALSPNFKFSAIVGQPFTLSPAEIASDEESKTAGKRDSEIKLSVGGESIFCCNKSRK